MAKESSDIVEQLKLKKFAKFGSAVDALEQAAALHDGKVTPMLSSLLEDLKDETKATLAVADPKLSNSIAQLPGLSLKTVSDSSTQDVFRAIRENLTSLLPDLLPAEEAATRLGLAHSLSRHKLRFSPDKVDTMIIQSIASLDVLDKQLNTYAMRVKEWYGWHFPELAKILNDNLAYSRVVLKMGFRTNARESDLSEILPEEIEAAVKAAAEISMGTEITDEDLEATSALAEQVVEPTEHRQNLGSLPVQPRLVLPSRFSVLRRPSLRALKTKHDTPKYGLIYHASLIGQATGKNKGKIARMLAAKSALGLRVDALSTWGVSSEDTSKEPTEEEKSQLGRDARSHHLRGDYAPLRKKWEVKEARKYNPDADGLTGDEPAADAPAPKKSKSAKTNGTPKKLVQEVDSDEEMADADGAEDSSDSSSEDKPAAKGDKAAKKAEKEAKKARKAERAAKREAKEAKKAAKEAKKAGKETKDSKKRKADDGDEKVEKKKKKKSKD
ncbi:unnamed protein product [Alternaria alternata]